MSKKLALVMLPLALAACGSATRSTTTDPANPPTDEVGFVKGSDYDQMHSLLVHVYSDPMALCAYTTDLSTCVDTLGEQQLRTPATIPPDNWQYLVKNMVFQTYTTTTADATFPNNADVGFTKVNGQWRIDWPMMPGTYNGRRLPPIAPIDTP
jgi:hypothetical protein